MRKLIFVSALLLCSAAVAQDPFVAMCGADYKKTTLLRCYASLYSSSSQLIDSYRVMHDKYYVTADYNAAGVAWAKESISTELARGKALTPLFLPGLRKELKGKQLALLPKLLAAVEVSFDEKDVAPGETIPAYRARIGQNHTAAVALFKEVEFSR